MLESLQSILEEPWKPVSPPALVAWLIFYIAFLAYAFSAHGEFLLIDNANLIVHEGGHNLFGWFGSTLGLWGRYPAPVVGPVSSIRLLLQRASDHGLRVLPIFLLRELALLGGGADSDRTSMPIYLMSRLMQLPP